MEEKIFNGFVTSASNNNLHRGWFPDCESGGGVERLSDGEQGQEVHRTKLRLEYRVLREEEKERTMWVCYRYLHGNRNTNIHNTDIRGIHQ